jgi:hypothetical protein
MLRIREVGFIAICASFSACADPPSPPPESSPVREPHLGFTPLSADIVSPYYGGLDKPDYRLLKSAEEWSELWSELEPRTSREQGQTTPNPVPVIDFNTHSLIVAAVGGRSHGGYAVEIRSVSESAGRILVTVMEKEPGPHCMTTQAIAYPISIATIPKTEKAVDFNILRRVESCE